LAILHPAESLDDTGVRARPEPAWRKSETREELRRAHDTRLGRMAVRCHSRIRKADERFDPTAFPGLALKKLRDGDCTGAGLPPRVVVRPAAVQPHTVRTFLDDPGMRLRLDDPYAGFADHDVIHVEPLELHIVHDGEARGKQRQHLCRR